MEKFKGRLKMGLIRWIMISLGAVAIILICFLHYSSIEPEEHTQSFMAGFQTGLFMAAAMIAIGNIFRCACALRSETALRKLYIKEMDERDKAIKNKMSYMGFWITIGTLMISSVIVGFYSVVIFKTLLAVLLFMCITAIICKIYYYKKM